MLTPLTPVQDGERVAALPLTEGKRAILDADDFKWVSRRSWYSVKNVGACCTKYGGTKKQKLGRYRLDQVIAGIERGFVRHVNGDKWDCRRKNLLVKNDKGEWVPISAPPPCQRRMPGDHQWVMLRIPKLSVKDPMRPGATEPAAIVPLGNQRHGLVCPHRWQEVTDKGVWHPVRRRVIHGECFYAARRDESEGATYLALHQLVLPKKDGVEVDHRNRDSLDCRDGNLQYVTRAENTQNRTKTPGLTSKYIGVAKTTDGVWQAYIGLNRVKHYLGRFGDEVEAAKARDKAALQFHSNYRLNFPMPPH